MPIYDYKCENCGNVTEFLLNSHNSSPDNCPDCGGINLERMLSASYMIKMGTPSSCGTCCEPSNSCNEAGCPAGGPCSQNN
ncbi:MAG: zinc ribbon domain-containing protein [Chloroflexi bacterium]|nr:zinc ribbon domain-containing protein [Chloroflexota bacterium]